MKAKWLSGNNRIYRALAVLLIAVCLCACSDTVDPESLVPDVELLDPVSGTTAYDYVQYRTLYDIKVYPAYVVPSIEEYTYETDQPFGGYEAMFGQAVNAGDTLIFGNTDSSDERITELDKSINDELLDYYFSYADAQQDLTQLTKAMNEAGAKYHQVISDGPAEGTPGYEGYQRLVLPYEGQYKKATLERDRKAFELENVEKSHKLSVEHNDNLMKIYAQDHNDAVVTAKKDGVVAGAGMFMYGDHIAQGASVIALASSDELLIRSEFINQNDINKALDVYAICNGERIEVSYDYLDSNEYQRLTKEYGTVYSSFHFESDSLTTGMYCPIVVVKDVRENVLCVPYDSIVRENNEEFVNLYEDGQVTKTKVKTGMHDDMYIEVLSGVKENDTVISSSAVASSKKTAKLSKGEISNRYSESGYLYFPSSEAVKNPVKNGSTYVKEVLVEESQQVKKGDSLLTIDTKSDTTEINRLNRQLQRQNERLVELMNDKAKDYSEEVNYERERAIRSRNRNIQKLNEQIRELTKDTGAKTITAPYDGIILGIADLKEGDLLYSGQVVMYMSRFDRCYIIVNDKGAKLNFGNDVTVTYKDPSSTSYTLDGSVVTVSNNYLSNELKSGYMGIALSEDDTANIVLAGSSQGQFGWYRTMFAIETDTDVMSNILLVPKTYVKVVKNSYYVKVKDKDGRFKYVSFVPGGSDNNNYWVAEGLSEGMEICYD